MADYNPSSVLTEPVAEKAIPDAITNLLGGAQYISFSYWLNWVFEQVTGTNPWQWVAEQYSGDWEATAKAGDALEKLGVFQNDFAAAITTESNAVFDGDWAGNAATSAQTYFSSVVSTIEGQIDALEKIGAEFKTMAQGMASTASAIKGLLDTLTDLCIAAALEAAAAAASSWTIIGPIVAGAAFAATITKAIGVWGTALEYHTHAWNAVQAFVGICAGYLGGLHGVMDKHILEGAAYNHPAV